MPRIFLSYRRADGVAAGARTAIYQALTKHYGARSVFMDVERLQLAQDFRESLAQELHETDLMIVLMGPAWVPIMRERGGAEHDFVRIEIETAIAYDKPVMPLLLGDNTVMPEAGDLPDSIQAIAFNHGVQLDTGRYFEAGMAKLIVDLDEHIFANFARSRRRRKFALIGGGVAVFVGLLVGAWAWLPTASETSTQRVEKSAHAAEQIASNTGRIADSLEDLSTQFSALAQAGGIIADATRPHELYHNARTYQQRGDTLNARQAYQALLQHKLDKLDPYLRYAELVAAQEGLPGAQRALRALTAAGDPALRDYAVTIQSPLPDRRRGLQQYIAAHAKFAPAFFHLAATYSSTELGQQTLSEIREENLLIEKFRRLDDKGELLRWFIDQAIATRWRQSVQQRLVANRARASKAVLSTPVNIAWLQSNSGWISNIQVAEPTTQLEWRTADTTEFRATPMTPNVDQRTGRPMPNPTFQLPSQQTATQVFVRYRDLRDIWQGPFELTFDPADEAFASNKRMLEMTRTSWLSFRDYDGKVLLYFSALMSYRGAIAEIRYGLNADNPAQRFAFKPWNKPGVATITPDMVIHFEVPPNTTHAVVQLRYKDDSQSAVVKFVR